MFILVFIKEWFLALFRKRLQVELYMLSGECIKLTCTSCAYKHGNGNDSLLITLDVKGPKRHATYRVSEIDCLVVN